MTLQKTNPEIKLQQQMYKFNKIYIYIKKKLKNSEISYFSKKMTNSKTILQFKQYIQKLFFKLKKDNFVFKFVKLFFFYLLFTLLIFYVNV